MLDKLSYLAGLIDGEGCISISQWDGQPSVRLFVINTDYRLMKWLVANFGGRVSKKTLSMRNQKDTYSWAPSSKAHMQEVLVSVRSYLVLKQRQADHALEFMRLTDRSNLRRDTLGRILGPSPENMIRRKEIVLANGLLNKRGI